MSDQVHNTSRIRVLLVDDERSLREPLTNFLGKYYTVEAAASGAEALEMVEKYHGNFDVALIDETLIPGPDGIEVMKQIRSRYPSIEAIIFTGWGSELREQALRAGAFRLIEKSSDKIELVLHIRNCAQQVRFNSINREMLASRGLDGLQSAIIRAAVSLAFADDAAVVLRDQELNRARIKRSPEAVAGQSIFYRHLKESNLTCQIMENGEQVSVPDTFTDPRVDPWLIEAGYQSFIGLPIPGESGIQGVLYVYSRSPNHFDELGHTTLLRTVAIQAGLAITNAAAEEKLAMHNRYMGALVAASRELSAARSQQEMFDIAWRFVQNELGLKIFFIALYDPITELLEFPLFMDQGVLLEEQSRKLDSRDKWGVTGYVVKENQEVFWANLAQEEKFRKEQDIIVNVHGVRSKSCFFYPLMVDNYAGGVISVQSQNDDGLTPVYLDALRALGNHLSVALKNIRLQDEEKQRRLEAEAIYRSTQAVSKSIEQEEVILQLFQTMRDVVPFDRATVQLIREVAGQKVFELTNGTGFPNIHKMIGKTYPLDSRPSYAQVLETRQTVIFPDIHSNLPIQEQPFPDPEGIYRSWMGVPLVADNEIIGLVTLNSRTMDFYTSNHARLAEMFASGVGQAVQNALHHEQIEHSQRMLEAVTEATQYIRSESMPHRLLFEVVHQACELFGFNYGALFYCNPFLQEIELTVSYSLPESLNGIRFSAEKSLAGKVALTGARELFAGEYAVKYPDDPVLAGLNIKTALAVPIQHHSDTNIERVLLLAEPKHKLFRDADFEILEKLSDQAAVAIQTSSFLSDDINRYERLKILQEINEFIQSRRDIDDILHLVLTGITAGYGLGFNRAVYLTIDHSSGAFVGKIAIGCLEADQARVDWAESKRAGLDDFANYLNLLNSKKLEPTPLHLAIENRVFHSSTGSIDELVNRLKAQRCLRLAPQMVDLLPEFKQIFQPESTVLAVPVEVNDEIIGMLIVDNKFNKYPIPTDAESPLITFVNAAELAIANDRLWNSLTQTREATLAITKVSISGDLTKTLRTISDNSRKVLDCHMFTLYTYDALTHKFTGLEHYGCLDKEHIRLPQKMLEHSTPYKIINLTDRLYHATEDPEHDTFLTGDFYKQEEIKSTLAIKLVYQDHPVGVLFINYRSKHHFTDEDIRTALLFADQAAIAIQNAQLFSKTERQARYLEELYESGKIISSSLSLKETLQYLAERARRLTGVEGRPANFCNVLLEEKGILYFTASAPEGFMPVGRAFDPHQSPCGLIGKAFLTGKSQLAEDRRTRPEYIEFDPSTLSELTVPITFGDDVIGIINVESSVLDAFNENDKRNLELLAAQAAIAIQNARRFDDLNKAQGIIGARTALAWTGMSASIWRHSIEKDAITIRDQVGLLLMNPKEKVVDRANMIQRLANHILAKPITTPLSSEEGIDQVLINSLVKERVMQLWERPDYPPARYQLSFELGDDVFVSASPEWLRRALDVLVENAVREVKQCPEKLVFIGTRRVNPVELEIYVRDTGRGIPLEIWSKLGEEFINRSADSSSMGIGLMMAQIIVSTYGGCLSKIRTDSSGSELGLRLPVSK